MLNPAMTDERIGHAPDQQHKKHRVKLTHQKKRKKKILPSKTKSESLDNSDILKEDAKSELKLTPAESRENARQTNKTIQYSRSDK